MSYEKSIRIKLSQFLLIHTNSHNRDLMDRKWSCHRKDDYECVIILCACTYLQQVPWLDFLKDFEFYYCWNAWLNFSTIEMHDCPILNVLIDHDQCMPTNFNVFRSNFWPKETHQRMMNLSIYQLCVNLHKERGRSILVPWPALVKINH